MNELFITYVDGRYQCYRSLDGIARTNVGPKWKSPREASDFIRSHSAIPDTSPLRDPALGTSRPSEVGASPRAQSEAPEPPPDRASLGRSRSPVRVSTTDEPSAVSDGFPLSLWDG